MKTEWYQHPTRVIQTNLQVRDTARIEPKRLAGQIKSLGANALVFNLGGIYAWYDSQVEGHHVNEFLPAGRDLVAEVIAACHALNIRFIARFDFSKIHDEAYLQHPDWVARDQTGSPRLIGAERPGGWSLLYHTCMQSPWRNEAGGAQVLREAVSRYDFDGLFYNAPFPTDCWCDRCRSRYEQLYQNPMPDDADDFDPSWRSEQMRDNALLLRKAVKDEKPDLPIILYYWDEQIRYLDQPVAELICDESQNILSRGRRRLSADWTPMVRMQLCQAAQPDYRPFGIIHSSPGMDWRHTGLPTAEYQYWLSQVPAAGGSLWHSLTGIPDTILDQRILHSVRTVNAKAKQIESLMETASPYTEAGLLWDGRPQDHGWLQALSDAHIPYTLLQQEIVSHRQLEACQVVIVPSGFNWSPHLIEAIDDYVRQGGHLITEGRLPDTSDTLRELSGLHASQVQSEPLTAAYLRLEPTGHALIPSAFNEVELLPLRGSVTYARADRADCLATLVPSFAPLEAVGAPPERASLPASRTKIPLITRNQAGSGQVISLLFSLSDLINEFGLHDHLVLAEQLIRSQINRPLVHVSRQPGIQMTVFRCRDAYLLHLINGIGKRPLSYLNPVRVTIDLPGLAADRIKARLVFTDQLLAVSDRDGSASLTVELPDAWQAIEMNQID